MIRGTDMSDSYHEWLDMSDSYSWYELLDMSDSYVWLILMTWVTHSVTHDWYDVSYTFESLISWVWVTHTHNVSYSLSYSWLMWYEVLIWVTHNMSDLTWVTHMSDSYSWYELLIDLLMIDMIWVTHMGWLRLVGSLKVEVSFSEYSLLNRALLQKRPIIVWSLLIQATPYELLMIWDPQPTPGA